MPPQVSGGRVPGLYRHPVPDVACRTVGRVHAHSIPCLPAGFPGRSGAEALVNLRSGTVRIRLPKTGAATGELLDLKAGLPISLPAFRVSSERAMAPPPQGRPALSSASPFLRLIANSRVGDMLLR